MRSPKRELDVVFERTLKWRLLKKSFTSAEGLKVLINSFRYYDLSNTGKVNKDKWVDAIYTNGLVIGISKSELAKLFDKYKEENTELVDYKKFAFDLFFKYNKKTSPNKVNPINNYYNNIYQQTDTMNSPKRYNNNAFLNINETNPVSQSQQLISPNYNNLTNSPPLIKRQLNNNYQNIRYNYGNILNNNLPNSNGPVITYTCTHVNTVKTSISYFKSKININNGLNYYRFIFDLKSKCSEEDKILKNYLPIALQNIGVFYTQNELQNLFSALGCSEITYNTFSLSKLIEVIKDEMNDFRKNIVINVFNKICQLDNNNNSLSLNSLKENYRPEMHPEVLNKRRSANNIYQQFTESLDIFSKLNNISSNITLDQFIDFYSGISSSVYDDNYFSYIMDNVWSNKENNNGVNNVNNVSNNVSTMQKSTSSPKISYNNLDIDQFNINYNYNDNNLKSSNYNRNSSVIDRSNNNSNAKINLPLFYYNRNNNNLNNLNNLSKSTNFTENKNNSVFTPNNKSRYEQLLEDEKNYLNEVNSRKISGAQSPSYKNMNANLMDKDLNLLSLDNKRKNTDISPIINKIKEMFILRGVKSIFYFQRMLLVYDNNHSGKISLNNLQNIIQTYNYNFSSSELNTLFNNFDKENTGFIQYNNLLMEIVGTMDMTRFSLVKKLFDEFPKNQNGNINIDTLKNSFCATSHYDVINGNKSNDEVYGEFLECIEIFREYNNNLRGGISKDELNYEDFCDFFGEISFGIANDYNFGNLIQNCWKINNDYYKANY